MERETRGTRLGGMEGGREREGTEIGVHLGGCENLVQ